METIAWEDFRNILYTKFFIFIIWVKKKAEFVALQQGDMSVAEYEIKFLGLERCAPRFLPHKLLDLSIDCSCLFFGVHCPCLHILLQKRES